MGVTVVAATHERSAGVWQAIMEAAVADPEIDTWRVELEARRRIDTERSLHLVLQENFSTMTNDLFWVILGPEVYLKLTGDLSLTREQYESYVRNAILRIARPDS